MISTTRFLGLVVSLALAGSATAQTPSPGREIVDGVVWKSKPNANDMANYYPYRAMRQGIGGWALLRCRVSADGRLEACRAPASFPKDEHFDDMALKLADKFRMAPATTDGQPVAGAMITIPITLVTPSGHNNVQIPQPGAGAILTLEPNGPAPCMLEGQPAAKCALHGLDWKASPTVGLYGPIVAAIGPENGLTHLECTAKGGALTGCRAIGEHLTQAGGEAMLALAPRFIPPERARDGSKVEGQQVIAVFDWPALNAAYAPVYRDASK